VELLGAPLLDARAHGLHNLPMEPATQLRRGLRRASSDAIAGERWSRVPEHEPFRAVGVVGERQLVQPYVFRSDAIMSAVSALLACTSSPSTVVSAAIADSGSTNSRRQTEVRDGPVANDLRRRPASLIAEVAVDRQHTCDAGGGRPLHRVPDEIRESFGTDRQGAREHSAVAVAASDSQGRQDRSTRQGRDGETQLGGDNRVRAGREMRAMLLRGATGSRATSWVRRCTITSISGQSAVPSEPAASRVPWRSWHQNMVR